MKSLLILSGKGGTGKTTVASSFIKIHNAKAYGDCDVDAPNLHLVTDTDCDKKEEDFFGGNKGKIDPLKCVGCGECYNHCRFNAIKKKDNIYFIDEYACEGCGVCKLLCKHNAVILNKDKAGKLIRYEKDFVFQSAELKMGRGNSGKLVSEVKYNLFKYAPETDLIIIDGSPGIGCPVIASITGTDLVLIVAEPSVSGLSDLKRLIKTADTLNVKTAICVNKYDICTEKAEEIKDFARANDIPFLGCLPYDNKAVFAMNQGKSVIDTDCPLKYALEKLYDNTMKELNIGG